MANKLLSFDQIVDRAKQYLDSLEVISVVEGARSKIYKKQDITEAQAERAFEIWRASGTEAEMFAKALLQLDKVNKSTTINEAVIICRLIADEQPGSWRAAANKCAERIKRFLVL